MIPSAVLANLPKAAGVGFFLPQIVPELGLFSLACCTLWRRASHSDSLMVVLADSGAPMLRVRCHFSCSGRLAVASRWGRLLIPYTHSTEVALAPIGASQPRELSTLLPPVSCKGCSRTH